MMMMMKNLNVDIFEFLLCLSSSHLLFLAYMGQGRMFGQVLFLQPASTCKPVITQAHFKARKSFSSGLQRTLQYDHGLQTIEQNIGNNGLLLLDCLPNPLQALVSLGLYKILSLGALRLGSKLFNEKDQPVINSLKGSRISPQQTNCQTVWSKNCFLSLCYHNHIKCEM